MEGTHWVGGWGLGNGDCYRSEGLLCPRREWASSGSGLCLLVSVESCLRGGCGCGREIGDHGVTNDGIKLCSSSHLTRKEQGNTCVPHILLISGF